MKNYKSILLLTFTILLGSCATNYEDEKSVLLSKPENTDLMNQFDAGAKQEEINKAEEEARAEEAKALAAADKKGAKKSKAPTTKAPVLKPEIAAKAPVEKPVATTKEAAPTAKAVTAPKISVAKTLALPADYPEEYKAYDAKSKEAWAKFNPIFYQGEQSIMAVSYLGVTAGYITIMSKEVVNLNGKEAYHFYARFKSSDSYRYFYWLDDKLDSYVEKQTFLPMKYSLVQREKKQNVDDLQLFDFKKMMTYNWYKRVKEGSNKDEKGEAKIPSLAQDSFSALQFIRGMPLNKGDKYELPVITRGKFWILKVEVMGEETTTVNGKDTRAIKIKAETNFPGVLQKSGDINFWYGIDAERRLLKFQAKIKLGSLYGELVEYKPGIKVQ